MNQHPYDRFYVLLLHWVIFKKALTLNIQVITMHSIKTIKKQCSGDFLFESGLQKAERVFVFRIRFSVLIILKM
jgi:hypothetical protein